MKFKVDDNLILLAIEARYKSCPVFSQDLYAELVSRGMIKDNPENEGKTVIQVMGSQMVSDVCKFLARTLYGCEGASIPDDMFDAFCALVIER